MLIKKENNTNHDLICELAHVCHISDKLARILIGRGFTTKKAIDDFLFSTIDNMPPFSLIPNIEKAAIIILNAIESKKRILIYGDYDCDGICAVSILFLFLKSHGIIADYYIPNRLNEGYGVNKNAANNIIAVNKPDLIITVDCGIGSVDEVAMWREAGIEVIVTDHHELPLNLPDCLIVSAKLTDNELVHDICGAGLAYYLTLAMGAKLDEYIDIAALATVADVVPLLNANRLIVKYGLEKINHNPRLVFSLFKDICKIQNEFKCSDLAFYVAPRVNSSGRVAEARNIVDAFVSDDYAIVAGEIQRMQKHNNNRQQLCDEVYKDALDMLKNYDFSHKNPIVLASDKWSVGVIGITAAKLANEFETPVILFAQKEDVLKGSGRSFKDFNLFNAINSIKNKTISFGGHSGACGLSIKYDRYEEFVLAFCKTCKGDLSNNLENNVEYEIDVEEIDEYLIEDIDKIEPCGAYNPRPQLGIKNSILNFNAIGDKNHYKAKLNNLDVLYFNAGQIGLNLFNITADYLCDVSINEFRNKRTCQGIVKKCQFNGIAQDFEEDLMLSYYKEYLRKSTVKTNISYDKLLAQKNEIIGEYGCAFIAYSTCSAFEFRQRTGIDFNIVYFQNQILAPTNTIFICPNDEVNLEYYHTVIFIDRPLSVRQYDKVLARLSNTANKRILVCDKVMSVNCDLNYNDDEIKAEYEAIKEYFYSGKKADSIENLRKNLLIGTTYGKIKFTIYFYILYEQKMLKVVEPFLITCSDNYILQPDDSRIIKEILNE